MNQGVHYVDQLRWIMGPVKSVAATMGTLSHERIEVEDIVSATIEFENGAVGTLMASTSMVPGFNQSLEVYGSKGSVRITNSKVQFAQFVTGDEPQTMWGLEGAPAPLVVDGIWQDEAGEAATTTQGQGAADPRAISNLGHVAHLKDLCECIHSGNETFMNGKEARYALELIVAVYRSAKTGQRVTFPLED
jgi:predicted dehydrogenase